METALTYLHCDGIEVESVEEFGCRQFRYDVLEGTICLRSCFERGADDRVSTVRHFNTGASEFVAAYISDFAVLDGGVPRLDCQVALRWS